MSIFDRPPAHQHHTTHHSSSSLTARTTPRRVTPRLDYLSMEDPKLLSALVLAILLASGASSCSTTPPAPSTSAFAPRASAPPARYATDLGLATELRRGDLPTFDTPLSAQDTKAPEPSGNYPNMYRRMGLSLGAAFYSHFDSSAQVDTSTSVGTTLDLEDLLGLDDHNVVARVDAFYAFSPRHRIDVSAYDIDRDGQRAIDEDIQVGPGVIPAGEVDTSLETLIVKADYRYNFVADTRTAIGASIGLHTMGIDLRVESTDFDVSEEFRVTAPLPVIGLHGEYALSERWKLLGSAELFQVDLGYAQGFLADNRLAIEHDLFDHFGWGLAFNGFQLDAEVEDSSLVTDLEYAYQGLFVYLRAYL
jgi:hypothetical protein